MQSSIEKANWLERFKKALFPTPKNRQQLLAIIRHSVKTEILDPESLVMIEGVLQVSKMQARDIMIPRSQMVVLEQDRSLEELLPIITSSKHSRFPIVGENKDEVAGILLAKDLLNIILQKPNNFSLQDITHPAILIPESKRLNILLKEFRLTRNHMAIVVDEYGSTAGLVTIEDVLEQIVGNIEDEYDIDENSEIIKKINNRNYIIKGTTTIEDFNEYFKVAFNDDEYDTIAGFLLQRFGYLPKRDEIVTIDNKLQFKVLNADNRRIRLLRLTLKDKNN